MHASLASHQVLQTGGSEEGLDERTCALFSPSMLFSSAVHRRFFLHASFYAEGFGACLSFFLCLQSYKCKSEAHKVKMICE